MNVYVAQLKAYFAESPADQNNLDIPSMLDLLYRSYTEYHPIESTEIRSLFGELEEYFQHLSPQENDKVFD